MLTIQLTAGTSSPSTENAADNRPFPATGLGTCQQADGWAADCADSLRSGCETGGWAAGEGDSLPVDSRDAAHVLGYHFKGKSRLLFMFSYETGEFDGFY